MIGFAAAPGLLGLLGVLWRTFAWLAVVWWVVAFGYALMRGFKYRRAGTVIRIGGVSMVLCGLILVAYWAVFDSFGGLLMFLLVVAVLIFHRAILDWMVRHSRTVKTAVRGDAPTPLQEAQDLFRRKGWDMTLRDLAGPFLMIPFPLIPEESLAPEPDSKAAPPEPTGSPKRSRERPRCKDRCSRRKISAGCSSRFGAALTEAVARLKRSAETPMTAYKKKRAA